MIRARVRCSYATYWEQTVDAEGATIDALVRSARDTAGQRPDEWESSAYETEIAIDAIAEGVAGDPSRATMQIPVPYDDSDRNGADVTTLRLPEGVDADDVTVRAGMARIVETHRDVRLTQLRSLAGTGDTVVTVRPGKSAEERPQVDVSGPGGATVEMHGWDGEHTVTTRLGAPSEEAQGTLVHVRAGEDGVLEVEVRRGRPRSGQGCLRPRRFKSSRALTRAGRSAATTLPSSDPRCK